MALALKCWEDVQHSAVPWFCLILCSKNTSALINFFFLQKSIVLQRVGGLDGMEGG